MTICTLSDRRVRRRVRFWLWIRTQVANRIQRNGIRVCISSCNWNTITDWVMKVWSKCLFRIWNILNRMKLFTVRVVLLGVLGKERCCLRSIMLISSSSQDLKCILTLMTQILRQFKLPSRSGCKKLWTILMRIWPKICYIRTKIFLISQLQKKNYSSKKLKKNKIKKNRSNRWRSS